MANRQTTITGLDSEKNYTIDVTAVNASGESTEVSTNATTGEYSAPGQPVLVGGTLTQTGFDITFTPVPSTETPTGYRAYLAAGGALIAENSGGQADNTLSITGQPAGDVEEIYIVAYDASNEGATSLHETFALQPDDFFITLTDRSDDTFVLSYTGGNGAVTFEVFSDATLLTSSVAGDIVITGLSVGTEYPNISVVAHNVDDTATTTSNTITVVPTLSILHSPGVQETFNDGFVFANWQSNAPLAMPSDIVEEDMTDSIGGSVYVGANVVNASNAFDNDEGTLTTSSSATFDFGWDFGGSIQIVKQIKVKTGIDGASSTVRAYTIYGGDASNNWTSIVSGELANIPNSWHVIDMSANVLAYNKYKLEFTSRYNTTSDIAEVEMLTTGDVANYSFAIGTTPSFYYEFSVSQDLEKTHFVMFEVKGSVAGQFFTASLDGFGIVPITIESPDTWETKYIPVSDVARANRNNIGQIRFTVTDTSLSRKLSFREVREEAPNYGISLNSVLTGSDLTLYWSNSSTPLAHTVFCYNNTGFDNAFNYVELDTSVNSYQMTGLLPSTNYYVGVASKDYDGSVTQVTEVENPVWIGVPVAPLVQPAISNITAIDFTVDFDSVDGASEYEVYINGTLYGTYPDNSTILNVLFPDSPATPCDVTYRAKNGSGTTSDSPTTRVVPTTAPTWVTPVPANGVDYDDVIPHGFDVSGYTITWTEVEGADSYDVEVSLDGAVDANGDFVTPVYTHTSIVGLTYDIPNFLELIYGKQYYWHVRGVNTYGAGDWFNPVNTFIVDVPAPVIVEPLNSATGVVLAFDMDWTPAIPNKWIDVNYQWEVVDGVSTVMGTADDLLVVTTQYSGTALSTNTVYDLRVRGYTALAPRTTTDNWVESLFTTVAEAPHAFDLLLPTNLAVVDGGNTTFTWEVSVESYRYDLYIDTVPATGSMVYQVNTGESQVVDLPIGLEYSWYVNAVNDVDIVQSTSIRTLTTKTEIPALNVGNTINDASSQTGEQATVVWSVVDNTGIVGYRVKWGTVSGTYTNTSSDIVGSGITQSVITGLVNGTSYYFVVVSYDASGNESSVSNESNAVLVTDEVAPPVTTFNAVSELAGEAIDLSWTIPSEFDRMKIVRKEGAFADVGTDPEGNPDVATTQVFAGNDPLVLTYEDDGS